MSSSPALAEAVASHPTMEFLTVKGFAVLSDFAGQELVESLSQDARVEGRLHRY